MNDMEFIEKECAKRAESAGDIGGFAVLMLIIILIVWVMGG